MKTIHKFLLLGIIILGFIILSFKIKLDSLIFNLLVTIVVFVFYFIDYFITKYKIKSSLYIKIGKGKRPFWNYIPQIILFVLLFFICCFDIVKHSFKEIHYFDFAFLLMILFAFLFDNFNYIILIKEKTIAINYSGIKEEWKLSKIVKVINNKNIFNFYKIDERIEVILDKEEDIIKAKQYLSERFKEKFIIEA